MKAGHAYCDASEEFQVSYEVAPAPTAPGQVPQRLRATRPWRYGLVAASVKCRCRDLLRLVPDHARQRDPRTSLAQVTRPSA